MTGVAEDKSGSVAGGSGPLSAERLEGRDPSRYGVGFRSVLLGLLGVVLICGITPYNNFVMNNTFLVGNLLPVAALVALGLMTVVLNGVLYRFRRPWALHPNELVVAFGMMLVSCTLPSGGLMQYLPGTLVSPYWLAAGSPATADLLGRLNLADWLFPGFASRDVAGRARDPITTMFMQSNPTASGFAAVPWGAWVTPAIAWGVLVMMIYGAVICLVALVRRQWMENERLRFPLAEVYGSLLEEPKRGRSLPPMLYSKLFLFTFAAVMLLHISNGVNRYVPLWPAIELRYNIGGLMSEEPWVYATYGLKSSLLMLTVVGISYFIPSKVAFSLVFFFFLFNAGQMTLGPLTGGISMNAQRDQAMGATIVFALAMLYTGRRHWAMILRAMFFRGRTEDVPGKDLPNAVAAWGLVACVAGVTTWLTLAGSPPLNALCIILVILLMYLVVARIVAETGLIYVQLHAVAHRPWLFAAELGPLSTRTTTTGAYLLSQMGMVLATNNRENSLVFAQHAVANADRVEQAAGTDRPMRGRRWGFPLCLLLALGVGFVVAGGSMLMCQYNYSATTDISGQFPINRAGTVGGLQANLLDIASTLDAPTAGFPQGHNGWLHLGIGALAAGVVAVGHLSFAGFPLHPIGVVMAYTFPLQNSWLGIFVGWGVKALIIRFGGSQMFYAAKPFFLGLIFGEAAAIAFWIVVNVIISVAGYPHRPIQVLLPAVVGLGG